MCTHKWASDEVLEKCLPQKAEHSLLLRRAAVAARPVLTGLKVIAVEAIEASRVEEKLCDIGETRFPAECEPGFRCFRQIARGDVVVDLRPFLGC